MSFNAQNNHLKLDRIIQPVPPGATPTLIFTSTCNIAQISISAKLFLNYALGKIRFSVKNSALKKAQTKRFTSFVNDTNLHIYIKYFPCNELLALGRFRFERQGCSPWTWAQSSRLRTISGRGTLVVGAFSVLSFLTFHESSLILTKNMNITILFLFYRKNNFFFKFLKSRLSLNLLFVVWLFEQYIYPSSEEGSKDQRKM